MVSRTKRFEKHVFHHCLLSSTTTKHQGTDFQSSSFSGSVSQGHTLHTKTQQGHSAQDFCNASAGNVFQQAKDSLPCSKSTTQKLDIAQLHWISTAGYFTAYNTPGPAMCCTLLGLATFTCKLQEVTSATSTCLLEQASHTRTA